MAVNILNQAGFTEEQTKYIRIMSFTTTDEFLKNNEGSNPPPPAKKKTFQNTPLVLNFPKVYILF